MRAYERFLQYAVIHTTSDDTSGLTPSSQCQFDLARHLVEEMRRLGIPDAHVDGKCYVYGSIPASPGCEDLPALGFCAHLDTASFNGKNVRPRLVPDYDGGDIVLGTSGRVLSPAQFPHLPQLRGKTLIVTDGATLLGADDKAGIAEILTMAETVLDRGLPHSRLCFSFPPDEEIGAGAKDLDLEKLGADVAYTVDGGELGMIQYESFNAAIARITITGIGVHPGHAKNIMRSALLVAHQLQAMLPGGETPQDTEGYEGFFHLTSLRGTVEEAEMEYIIRDHDETLFEGRKRTLLHIAQLLNDRWGEGTVRVELRDQYRNMAEVIRDHLDLIETAKKATLLAGVQPATPPIRGGTDGCQLSFRGLPCPDLGTGAYACHGPYEHITAEDMDKVTEILLNIVGLHAGS